MGMLHSTTIMHMIVSILNIYRLHSNKCKFVIILKFQSFATNLVQLLHHGKWLQHKSTGTNVLYN